MCAALYAGGCGRWVQCRGFEISIVAVFSLQSASAQRSWITEFDEKYLRQFILEDKLGICADLEKQMEELVGTYFCAWTEATKSRSEASDSFSLPTPRKCQRCSRDR